MRRLAILSMSLFLILTACEREHRGYGGAEGPELGSPEYTVTASLSTVPGTAHLEELVPKAESGVVDGPALFTKNCGACHQATGLGIPGVFPPLDKSPYVIGDNVDRLAAIMLYGLVGPIKVLGTTYSSAMAGLGGTMSDEELAAVATYIRTSWSNSAGAVDAATIAQSREKWGSRGPFTIQELGEEE